MGMIPFNGVKVFSATKFQDREVLGETVTAWIRANQSFDVTDVVVTQSSDNAFHCVAMSVFYTDPAWLKPNVIDGDPRNPPGMKVHAAVQQKRLAFKEPVR